MLRFKQTFLSVMCCATFAQFSVAQDLTNEGTDFWCAFTETFDHLTATFQINISSRYTANGTVDVPGFTQNFTVTPGSIETITIPSSIANIIDDEVPLQKAIHISADMPITAFATTYHLYRSEATILLPENSLGSNYVATTYANRQQGINWQKSQMMIVAGSDAINVEINPSCNTEGGHLAGNPWTVSLNPGEIYLVQAADGLNDITGTSVSAVNGTDKFTVFSGHAFATVGQCTGGTADPLYEIAYPVESHGKQYVLVKTEGQNQNAYRVVILENGTELFKNNTSLGTFNAGDIYDELFTDEAVNIHSCKPFILTQSMVNATTCSLNNDADPAMLVLHSNEQMLLDTVTFFAVSNNNQAWDNYVNIITKTAETGMVMLNNAAVTGWTPTPGDAGLSYAIATIPTGSNTVTTSGEGFLAYTYGHQWAESYLYSAGARVNSLQDSISFTQVIGNNADFCDMDTVQFTPFILSDVPVSYEWFFGDGGTSTQMSPTHVYNTDGVFPVELVVHFTCTTDTIHDTLEIYSSPTLSSAPVDVTCFGFTDGQVDLTMLTGTPNYSFTWSNGETTEDVSGLAPGQYDVQIIDGKGCTAADTVTITEPAEMQINVSVIDPLCYINGLGSATVDNVVGGDGNYTYSWSSGGNAATEIDLTGGNYTVTVTDGNTCESTFNFTISEALPVNVALIDTTICVGGTADLVALASNGAGGPYTFEWIENGVVLGVNNVSPTQATCYTVVATDQANCPSDEFTLCVDLLDPLSLQLATADICPDENAEITSTISGGDGNYNFDWQSNGFTVASTQDLNFAQTDATQDYCLVLSDGCETPDITLCETVELFDLPLITIPFQAGCPPFTASFNGAVDLNQVSTANWYFGNGTVSSQLEPDVIFGNSGWYDATVTYTTNDGCIVDATLPNAIEVYDEVEAEFSYNGSSPVITVDDTEVHFSNHSTNGYTFAWDFGDGNGSSNENPTHIYPDLGDQNYTVTLTVESANGCTDEVQQNIFIESILLYYVPNAFTPDGDAYNEVFMPVFTEGFDPYDYHLTMFNRYGEIIFESYDATVGWDGTYGIGGLVEDGLYIWQIEFGELSSDKKNKQRGHVTVLK